MAVMMDSSSLTLAAAPDWSGGLPKHIMDSILDNLVSHSDYIHFVSVCRNWCSVALEDRNDRNRRRDGICRYHHHQLPMLMIPKLDSTVHTRSLYSVSGDRVLGVELNVSYPFRQIGSSFGWLISLDGNYTVNIYNPFSGKNIRVLHPLWVNDEEIGDMNNIFNKEYFVLKAVLSADPSLYPDDYILVLINGFRRGLALTGPGFSCDKRWFHVHSEQEFEDVIYSAAEGRLFAVSTKGVVFSFDVYTKNDMIRNSKSLDAELLPPLKAVLSERSHPFSDTSRYLVESCEGDLLQVVRFKAWEEKYDCETNVFTTPYKVSEFKVFKFNKTGDDWVEIKSLGDQVVFLGDNSSVSVLASDFPGCRRGSIYYSFCYRFHPSVCQMKPPHNSTTPFDMGVVNLESGLCGPLMCPEADVTHMMRVQTPTWLIPTILKPRFRGLNARAACEAPYKFLPHQIYAGAAFEAQYNFLPHQIYAVC